MPDIDLNLLDHRLMAAFREDPKAEQLYKAALISRAALMLYLHRRGWEPAAIGAVMAAVRDQAGMICTNQPPLDNLIPPLDLDA